MKTISTDKAALPVALWKSVLLRGVEKVLPTHILPIFAQSHQWYWVQYLVLQLVNPTDSPWETVWMTLLRGLEQCEGEQMILFFRNSPTLYIAPECLFLLVPQKSPQVPKQIGSSGRGSKWKKGSVCRQVLQVRENSEKKNSKTWSWDCYRVEYFPLFSRR